jgi:hypothetical protein
MADLTYAKKKLRDRARVEARRKARELEELVESTYHKPVEDWDWEELSMGMPRDEDGKFPVKKPPWVTAAVQTEVQRRMKTLSEKQLMTHAMQAIECLSELMTNNDFDDFGKPVVPASVKADAAKYVLNQVIGTPKARVEVSEGSPIMELMGGILVNPDGLPAHPVIDGEVVDDEGDGGE